MADTLKNDRATKGKNYKTKDFFKKRKRTPDDSFTSWATRNAARSINKNASYFMQGVQHVAKSIKDMF